MTKISKVKLKWLLADDKEAVSPSVFPNETFTLFSIPSYDTGEPETVRGSVIGSSKVLLKDQDILLSRIVPHIRRCWIVNGTQKYRKIGSGEWIVFRPSKEVHPKYLRYFFLTGAFHKKFLQTVRGVGGSLLRADPKQVGEFEIPVPPLSIQKKIITILDRADSLRQKDKELLEKYNQLAQSIFHEMFAKNLSAKSNLWGLSELIEINPSKSVEKLRDDQEISFVPMANVGETGEFDASHIRSYGEVKGGYTYFKENDVLFAKITPCMENGKSAIARNLRNGIGFGSTEFHVLRPSEKINGEFIYWLLHQEKMRNFAKQNMTGSAGQKRINQSFFSKVRFSLPSIYEQNKFKKSIALLNNQKTSTLGNIHSSEILFQSLLQKAFKGELVKEP
jgi:type I restriction enzyme S subunit